MPSNSLRQYEFNNLLKYKTEAESGKKKEKIYPHRRQWADLQRTYCECHREQNGKN